ncbi:metallophosphoesterase [Undibacterium amnicola]|uniref:Metallophosphoesterase n=1 Tax=Undibacterium amnicola TaxID=1834038 RepID=A0ABR6XN66_9BURK|nr:metallophosphoesterase [Undibacterium amnicola]MBC3830733.1 metallophosphoesterase [Undibacterium amnicola]
MKDNQIGTVLVMVVDDQLDGERKDDGRKEIYKKWFAQVSEFHLGKWAFDVQYCSTLDAVAKVVTSVGQPFLAVVDMVLDSAVWSPKSVSQLDQKLIDERWPLLLVSARFDSNEAIERANRLVGKGSDLAPFQFLTWSSISRAVEGVEQSEVAFIVGALLARARGQDLRFVKNSDDPIEILHITDPHFGKASWDVGSLISLRLARRSCGLQMADFLAITGDIADRGNPSQYQLAKEYFEALFNNRVIEGVETGIARDRVFVCPGNHDFSRPVALAANISTSVPYKVESITVKENEWIRNLAWKPYYDFEADVTEHSEDWILSPGYRLNTRFLSSGIVVLELNVERYAIDDHQAGVGEDDLRKTINAAVTAVSAVRKNSECLLVLAHRHESNIWDGLSKMVQSNLQGLAGEGPLLFMCGHEHSPDVVPGLKDKALFVRGVPPSVGPTLPTQILPMVNCIRFNRSGGVVIGVEVHQFHQHANGWQIDVDGPRGYEYNNGKWRAKAD